MDVTVEGIVLGKTTLPMLDAFKRLLELLDEPDTIPALAPLIQQEIYYRLLVSDQGARLWHASAGSQSHRIARATDWLKSHYIQPLRRRPRLSRAVEAPRGILHSS